MDFDYIYYIDILYQLIYFLFDFYLLKFEFYHIYKFHYFLLLFYKIAVFDCLKMICLILMIYLKLIVEIFEIDFHKILIIDSTLIVNFLYIIHLFHLYFFLLFLHYFYYLLFFSFLIFH